MKKKLLAITMAAVCVLGLAACGSSDTGSASDSTSSSTEAASSSEQASSEEKETGKEDIYTMGETDIVDDKGVKVTVTEVQPDGLWGFTLKVKLENTTDKTLMYAMENTSVNGYMCDPFWSCEVAAGKSANSEISFDASTLEECNIESVDDIEFELRVYDSDNLMDDSIIDDVYHIYPTEKSKKKIKTPKRNVVDGEQVVDKTDDYVFIIQSVDTDGMWGYTLHCYLQNKTDKDLTYTWEDVSVNGTMCDPFWASTVAAGKRAYVDISFGDSTLEDSGITADEVSDIEYTLKIYDEDDWMADPLCEKTFTYNPGK